MLALRLPQRMSAAPQAAILPEGAFPKEQLSCGSRFVLAHAQSQFDEFPGPFLSVSLGIATAIPNDQNSVAIFFAAAEEALFQAKRKGHNCVILTSSP